MRKRDKHKYEIDLERDERNAWKEKQSQQEGYVKKKKPDYNSDAYKICYKSTGDVKKAKEEEKDSNDDDDDDDDEEEKISTFNETVNMKAKQAGVYLPLDVFDKGKFS